MKHLSVEKSTSIIFQPAGNLMYGRAMLHQFCHELELIGADNPVMLTTDSYRSRAMKAAAILNQQRSIAVVSEPAAENDFLILAGGKTLIDRWRDDPRPKAWIMLDEADLRDYSEPVTEFIVADSGFIKKGDSVQRFMEEFAFSISAGMASLPGELLIPAAFTYSCRTTVITGHEALEELPNLINRTDSVMKTPLILTDKGIKDAGLFDILDSVLSQTEYEVFDAIPPDSSSRIVNEISRLYKQKNCDGIIAMGGGSVLDTGKGVFLNVSLNCEDLSAMAGSNIIPELQTPFIAVPTTSGTGSEVTKVAVVNDEELRRKTLYVSPNLMPDAAILDSRLTVSLPPHLTSITGMDALSHAVEAYTCMGKNPVSDQMAWTAITLIRDNLIPVINEPDNLEMRKNLAIASNMAGQAFSNSMVGMVHTIGHSVGAVCHAPHGSCMSVLLPVVLEYNFIEIQNLLSELLTAVAGSEYADSIPYEERARETIECIRRMNRELRELTSGRHPLKLGDIKGRDGEPLVKKSHFQLIAETSLGDASIVYNPVELRIPDILKVLEDSY